MASSADNGEVINSNNKVLIEQEESDNVNKEAADVQFLNYDLSSLKLPEIRNILREALESENTNIIRNCCSKLCLAHEDIWLEVGS